MSAPEGLDIRAPIGGLFTLLGVMLAGYGLVAAAGRVRVAPVTNVNLWWGLVMLRVRRPHARPGAPLDERP